MKTHRMSRWAESRDARKEMTACGRASPSCGELLAPDIVLTGRRFRRAKGLTHAESTALEMFTVSPSDELGRPMFSIEMVNRTRQILGHAVS